MLRTTHEKGQKRKKHDTSTEASTSEPPNKHHDPSEKRNKRKRMKKQHLIQTFIDDVNSEQNFEDSFDETRERLSETSTCVSKPSVEMLWQLHKPTCWSNKQLNYFVTENKWVRIRQGKLGCATCFEVGQMEVKDRMGAVVSPEWTTFSITHYGESLFQQQRSLRKKVFEHKKSIAHKLCERVCQQKQSHEETDEYTVVESQTYPIVKQEETFSDPETFEPICEVKYETDVYQELTRRHHEETCVLLRTAYNIVKTNRPFEDLERDLLMLSSNGCHVPKTKVSCEDICNHVASAMRHSLVQNILETDSKIAIILDEMKDLCTNPTLLVYLRTSIADSKPINVFLGSLMLDKVGATQIVEYLETLGLDGPVLANRLVAITTNGSSGFLGVKSDVPTLLQQKFPNIILWNCPSHILEQSVGEIINKKFEMNGLNAFIEKLCSVFKDNPRKLKSLSKFAKDLKEQIVKIGQECTATWISSSFKMVQAIFESYQDLYGYFSCSSEHKNQQLTFLMSSVVFLKNFGVIYDALREMNELATELQQEDVSLVNSHRSICRQIQIFEGLTTKPGFLTKQILEAVEKGSFLNIQLHQAHANVTEICSKELYTELVENLKNKLLTTVTIKQDTEPTTVVNNYQTFIEEVKVLHKEYWPDELPNVYGENQMRSLCTRFCLDPSAISDSFVEFRETGGKKMDTNLKLLQNVIKIVPISTAECRRGLTRMYMIMKHNISNETASNVLFIQLNGPPVNLFDPERYTSSWMDRDCPTAENNSEFNVETQTDKTKEMLWKLF